ncbi:ABC transporter permease [Halobaculum roseum]|uniref:FtsX-like permease family protein n=1 Tax=Halobaculum roseum TaxID=2175149 RepID=A0ABD5MMF5_9EURY|nr:ABC transporter permease [Halobaculum roseum]QZY03450.1 ABC transporter permease [Halobaculum roseum]
MRDAGLLRRWSRRDWLSVAVVAVTTAFLIGTALLLLSAGSYTATLEEDLSTTATASYHDTATLEEADRTGDRIGVAVASVEVNGTRTRLVGVPPDAPAIIQGASVDWKPARLPHTTDDAGVGPVSYRHTVRIVGADETLDRTVRPAENESVFPGRWYADDPAVADRLGDEGTFVIDPDGGTKGGHATGVALVAALPYLYLGIQDVLRILSLAGVAGAVVVVVVVYNVTQMTVRDRRRTIRVLRSTGADPLRVGGLIAGRATAIAVVGVLAGVILGVAAPPALVAGARTIGLPVTLPTGLTVEKVQKIVALGGLLVAAGASAGVATAIHAVRGPPAMLAGRVRGNRGRRLDRESEDLGSTAGGDTVGPSAPENGSPLGAVGLVIPEPEILDWRTALPTAATLSVFVLIVLLVGGLVGVMAPLTATSTGTIAEPGAIHPLNSRMDADYASSLRAQGVAASPEIIAAQASYGRPYLLRGANYSAFSRVTGAELTEGREPLRPNEAVIGADLARTLDVERGDTITIGGSVSPLVDRVTVVGVFAAPGAMDDQLIVPRATIAPGATGDEDTVHVIRTEAIAADTLEEATASGPQMIVTRVTAPDSATAGEPVSVEVEVQNVGTEGGSRTLEIRTGNRTRTRTVDLAPGETETITVTERWNRTGAYPVSVGPFERTVQVTSETALTLPPEFPDSAPPGETLLVPARTANGTVVPEATVRFGEMTIPVSNDGIATVPLPDEPGEYRVRVSAPNRSAATTTITVTPDAAQEIGARVDIEPTTGTPVTRPNVSVYVANPWGRTLERNLTLVMPNGAEQRSVTLNPGNVSRIRIDPERVGFEGRVDPGTYTFRLFADGELVATARYTVTGTNDATGSASLPSEAGSYASGTGLGTVITRVFGNIQVLFGGMVALAGASTISGTVATFARAVHSRRQTVGVYRSTGATRGQLLSVLVRDAVLVAVPAALLAVVLAAAVALVISELDLLVAFGFRIDLPLASPVIAVAVVGSVLLAALSVCIAAVPFLAAAPSRLIERET